METAAGLGVPGRNGGGDRRSGVMGMGGGLMGAVRATAGGRLSEHCAHDSKDKCKSRAKRWNDRKSEKWKRRGVQGFTSCERNSRHKTWNFSRVLLAPHKLCLAAKYTQSHIGRANFSLGHREYFTSRSEMGFCLGPISFIANLIVSGGIILLSHR